MKRLNYYDNLNLTNDDEVFAHLIDTLRPGVADWHYLVDWDRVFKNTRDIELQLNKLNYLLGKEDFDDAFRYLVRDDPAVLRAFPVLVVRTSDKNAQYTILSVDGTELRDRSFDFSVTQPTDADIDNLLVFIKGTGLIKIFEKDGVKNLVDYVLGVEAGLNSNARKNRGGIAMETVCEALLNNLGCDYIRQATPKAVFEKYGVKLTGGEGRQYDFVVKAPNGLNVIEVNCYSGGGSKLDKTASDYRSLQQDLNGQATFIWITDGYGWRVTGAPLRKTFDVNDYILNIKMVKDGALKEIFKL